MKREAKMKEKVAEEVEEEIEEEVEEEIEEEVEEEIEEEVEEEIEEEVEERIYTIPLRRAWISPRKKRAPRATRLIKSFIKRHMKPEALIVSNEVNNRIWSRGIEKPPRKIRVRATRDKEGTVIVYLAEG
jgi:large subunit ribosomal protein L31e